MPSLSRPLQPTQPNPAMCIVLLILLQHHLIRLALHDTTNNPAYPPLERLLVQRTILVEESVVPALGRSSPLAEERLASGGGADVGEGEGVRGWVGRCAR